MVTLKERLNLAAEIAASLQGINPNIKYDLELHISKAQSLTKNIHESDVICSFSVKELDLIAQALNHLHNSNASYLVWKKDEFSQKEIPKEMERIMEVYHKVHKLRV